YLKGFSENQERREGERLHRQQIERVRQLERKYHFRLDMAADNVQYPQWEEISAELSDTGLKYYACRACLPPGGRTFGFTFQGDDRLAFDQNRWTEGTIVRLSSGPHYVRALSPSPQGLMVFILSPLGDFSQSVDELLDAFLLGGFMLLFLTAIVSL